MFDSETPQPPKSGNVWKWIGIGCGGALLLFILLGAGLAFFVQRSLNLSFGTEQAEQAAQDIMEYEIPGGSVGLMAMNIGGVQFAGVMSAQDPHPIILVMGKIGTQLQGDPAEFQKAMQDSIEQQQGSNFKTESATTESKELCGQTVDVLVSQGKQTTSGQADQTAISYQATVTYLENLYFVSLTTTGNNAADLAEQVFNSLQCK
jgi:hypothetical protein